MINKYLEKLKKEINITKALLRSRSASNGMSYVELIVVLSIFSVISSVAIYNYGDFQARVDIKNLGSDIALKIVEAQKSSLNGVLPPSGFVVYDPAAWKPSYGVFFGTYMPKQFYYVIDLNNNKFFDSESEIFETVSITKNNSITTLTVVYQDGTSSASLGNLLMTFTRPDSGATIVSSSPGPLNPNIDYVQITVESPNGAKAYIKVYPSGRIQVN
jgi:type II secretory pathway pseudopilin PulG